MEHFIIFLLLANSESTTKADFAHKFFHIAILRTDSGLKDTESNERSAIGPCKTA